MEKLDLKINSLNLSTRTYNSVIRGIRNLLKKEEDSITIRDLISLSYRELRHFRNLGNRGFSELINEVHMLGLKFDFEDETDINNSINPTTMEDCLFLQKKYLTKIKAQQEKIKNLKEELETLKHNKEIIDEMILILEENNKVKDLNYDRKL